MAYGWFRFISLVLFYFFICLLDLIAVCVGTLASWRQVQRGDDRRVIRWLFPTARRFVDNTLCAVGLKVVGQQDVVDSHSGVAPERDPPVVPPTEQGRLLGEFPDRKSVV